MARRNDWWFDTLSPREPAGRGALATIAFVSICAALTLGILINHFAGPGMFDFVTRWQAQKVVADMLLDPDSARFRNMTVVHLPDQSALICGEVDGRNRMNGYGGYARFVVSKATGQAVIRPQSPPSESGMYDDQFQCERATREADKELSCERAKRTTADYKAAKLFDELAASCPAG
jgi:hypothetical protein